VSTCKIKQYEMSDAEDLVIAVVESAAEVGQWMGWCHPGYSLDEARDWIKRQHELTQQDLAYEFAILRWRRALPRRVWRESGKQSKSVREPGLLGSNICDGPWRCPGCGPPCSRPRVSRDCVKVFCAEAWPFRVVIPMR
jgi:hypothetical protein